MRALLSLLIVLALVGPSLRSDITWEGTLSFPDDPGSAGSS